MKRIAFVALLLGMLAAGNRIMAASATPSGTPTDTTAKQINDLKDRLATKVAQLRQTQRRAIFGKVKSVSVSTITVETKTKDIKIELVDEVKVIQYLKGQRTKLTTNDIDKGDGVVVFGDYDATVDILKASVILIQNTIPVRIAGTITAIDKTEYTLSLTTADGQSYVVDIETTTKTVAWDKDNGLQKGGFSKMNSGDTVQILGTAVAKKDNRVSAIRILDIGNLTGTTPTQTPSPSPTTTVSPTSTPKKSPTPTPSS